SLHRAGYDIAPRPVGAIDETNILDAHSRPAREPILQQEAAVAVVQAQLDVGTIDLTNRDVGRRYAGAEFDAVVATGIVNRVITVATRELIHIIAAAAVEGIVAGAAVEDIVA